MARPRLRAVLAACLLSAGGAAVRAQGVAILPNEPPALAQPQFLSLSLMDALVVVGGEGLAGVFSFVPEAQAPTAFAIYLLHYPKALKRFLKRAAKDLKNAGGINEWDRNVFATLQQFAGEGSTPPVGVKPLSESVRMQVAEFVLARPLSLQELMVLRGKSR
ncbi:MAG: hypothetical protein HY554_14765 [Elusimicrobia bacterium]|nr:hypothetical protein [Elusimicrobiota bacterium]